MTRFFFAALVIVLTSTSVLAQTAPVQIGSGFCGFPSAATPPSGVVSSGAVVASASVSAGSITTPTIPVLSSGNIIGAVVYVQTNTIRERHDGTAPTSDMGVLYGTASTANGSESPVAAAFIVCGSDLTNLKLTGASANASRVYFTFYGSGR